MVLHMFTRRQPSARLGRVLPVGNSAALLLAALALLGPGPAAAEDAPRPDTPPAPDAPAPDAEAEEHADTDAEADPTASGPLPAPLLDSAHAEAAFRMAEGWVRDAAVPDEMDRRLRVTGAFGVRVSLRDAGQEVGAGEAFVQRPEQSLDAPGPPVDLVPLLAEATAAALDDYRQTLRDARARAGQLVDEITGDEESDDARTPDTERLNVGLEIAHRLQSVHLPRTAPTQALYSKFAPGFHGLRVKGPDDEQAAVTWPSLALAWNSAPKSQVVQPLARLGYPIDAIERVARTDGPALQRFETRHILRPSRSQPIERLVRGNVATPRRRPVSELVQITADRIAGHLGNRFIRDDQVRGTYHPSTNRFDPPIAGPTDSALAAYALARYSRVMRALDQEDVRVQTAGERARAVAASVARGWLERDEGGPAAGALCLLSFCEMPVGGAEQVLRDRLGAAILALRREDGRFRSRAEPEAPPVNLATSALIAASLTALHAQTRDPLMADAARAALDAAYARVARNPDVSALPWVMIAHDRAAGTLAEPNDVNRGQWRGLAGLVDLLNDQHIFERPLLGPSDVVGGFELSKAPPGSPPNPDWRTGQLLLFLSVALRHEQVRGDRNPFDWLLPAQGAARFLARLTFDAVNDFYVKSPEDTLGGVRISLWDNTLAVAPSAIGLLALTELQATSQVLNQALTTPAGQAAEVPTE